jgi:hypothetical protein
MRRSLASLLAALLVVAAAAAAGPAADTPVLRMVDRTRGGDALVRVDPVTLEPVSPPIGGFQEAGGHAYSPDGRLLALGSGFDASGRVQIVDVEGWRRARRIEVARRGPVWPLAWPDDRRLLAARYTKPGRSQIVLLDPLDGRVLRRHGVDGLSRAKAFGSGVALLASPRNRVGPARVVTVDLDGNLRSIALDRIRAGYDIPRGPRDSQRVREPGFAVDPETGRAFVVAAGASLVAAVDLGSGTVEYHRVAMRPAGAPWSPGRASAAKGGPGDSRWRDARWLGEGAIAVTGEDRRYGARGALRMARAVGVWRIDTERWTASLLARRPSMIAVVGGRLLAVGRYGPGWDQRGKLDAGLLAFDPDGWRAFRRFAGEDVSIYGAHADRAYVWVRRTRSLHTVDVTSGQSLHRRTVGPARLPWLLVPEGPLVSAAAATCCATTEPSAEREAEDVV